MLESFFYLMMPYMDISEALAQRFAPLFLILVIFWGVSKLFLFNEKLDFVNMIVVPFLLAALVFTYTPLIKFVYGIQDLFFNALPRQSMSFGDIWEEYKNGFVGEDGKTSFLEILRQGMGVMSMLGTWAAVQVMGLARSFLGLIMIFFKVIIIISGPFAISFSIFPFWRKIIGTWFTFMIYFSMWALSLWIVDALILGLFKVLLNGGTLEATAGVVAKGAQYTVTPGSGAIAKTMEAMKSVSGAAKLGGKTVAKNALMIVGKGAAGFSGIATVGSFLYPFLALSLYWMVPSITRFFYMKTDMETALSALTGFVSTKAAGMWQKSKDGSSLAGSSSKYGAKGIGGMLRGGKSVFEKLRGRSST